MKSDVQITVYSPSGTKLCELYNSACQFSGQAFDLSIKKTLGEIHTLTFSLPTMIEDETGELVENFRWDHIKNENLIYVTIDGMTDVYRIKSPEDGADGKKLSVTVTCLHRSEILKTRNLTQTYDTFTSNAEGHMTKALEGTGWGLGPIDYFCEDNIYEKTFTLSGYVPAPSDMAFGAYAEVIGLTGATEWSSNDGWQSAQPKIVSIGKNLFDGMLELGHLDVSTGAPVYMDDTLRYRSINYIYVKPFRGETLVLSGTGFASADMFWYGSDQSFLASAEGVVQQRVPATASWLKFMLRSNPDGTAPFTVAPASIQLELNSVTEYEAYKAPYTIDVGALGAYDTLDRSVICRATAYNEFNHSYYKASTAVTSTLSLYAVKLYLNGIVYLDNEGVGTVSCSLVYSVDTPDGAAPKEMLRSMSKDSGTSANDNLKSVADLFGGNLVFDGYNKTVGLVKTIGKDTHVCFKIGKNMKSIKRTRSTTDCITRLYVVNQTSESGYIGIEDVNPLGTSFILDFGYFIDAGLLSDTQIMMLDAYKTTISAIASDYRSCIAEMYTRENNINGFIGQTEAAFADVSSNSGATITIGQRTSFLDCADPEKDDVIYVRTTFNTWQKFTVMAFNASTRVVTLNGSPISATKALWMTTPPAGTIGATIIKIQTKQDTLSTLQRQYDDEDDADIKAQYMDLINSVQAGIDELQNGTASTLGLFSLFTSLMLEMNALISCKEQIAAIDEQYATAGATFESVMGDAIRDGIFPAGDYAAGQELTLYADAVKYLYEAARPKVSYTVDAVELSKVDGYEIEAIEYGDLVYVTEDRLGIENVQATVTTYTETPLTDKLNTFSVDNYKDSTKWFEDMAAATKKIKTKAKIYDRASSIDPNGLINPSVLSDSLSQSDAGSSIDLSNNTTLHDYVTTGEAEALLGYRVETSVSYTTLTDLTRSTTFRAHVYHGDKDVTYAIPAENFVWIRTSPDSAGDDEWNSNPSHRGVKSITLDTTDIHYIAHISCKVTIPD